MNSTLSSVLHALFVLASQDHHATILRVAKKTGLSRAEVETSLAALDRAGLVDADRVRLTLPGLAYAASGASERVIVPRVVGRQAA
jgi:DNA-binding IclR family transcriptional regulator